MAEADLRIRAADVPREGGVLSGCVGIVREWKTDAERRAPLTPGAVAELTRQGIRFLVEPSPVRIFEDAEFAEAGAELTSDLSACDLVLGIKEMPIDRLKPGRPHVFFSHTIKGQSYNMPLLKALLDRRCTLIDYELVADDRGRRLIFFGVQAGQAGMIDSLWTLGQRLAKEGHDTALSTIEQASAYGSLVDAKAAILAAGDALREEGLPDALHPLVVGVTGVGNVSRGAQEILDLLEPLAVRPEDVLAGDLKDLAGEAPVVKVVFRERHLVVRKNDDAPYSREEYRSHPERYDGCFMEYVPHVDVLVTGNYWDGRYPRLVTKEGLRASWKRGIRRPRVIGDISCDVEGGVECTVRATLPDDPVFVWDPVTGVDLSGMDGDGIAIMAVDILPAELPRESSEQFSRFLLPAVPALVAADWDASVEDLALPAALHRAVVAHQGTLTSRWRHLEALL